MPYIWNADGSTIPWNKRGNTPENYISQLNFTNTKISELVTEIAKQSNREYIIILQSDEGPRVVDLGFENTLAHEEALQIHGRILNALYFPDMEKSKSLTFTTPVNTFRHIFNHCFGMNLDILPDQAYLHGGNKIFNFTDITEILGQPHTESIKRTQTAR